jgi:hypothetical protein
VGSIKQCSCGQGTLNACFNFLGAITCLRQPRLLPWLSSAAHKLTGATHARAVVHYTDYRLMSLHSM